MCLQTKREVFADDDFTEELKLSLHTKKENGEDRSKSEETKRLAFITDFSL